MSSTFFYYFFFNTINKTIYRPVLIQDIGEEIDPALDNVLEKNFIKSGSIYKVATNIKKLLIFRNLRCTNFT